MQSLIKPLTSSDVVLIRDSLNKLFALHDKHASEKKVTFVLEEIESIGAPADAIIKGIESLFDADIKNLKFSVIKTAIKLQYTRKEKKIDCKHCHGNGVKSMLGKKKESIAYACICEAGDLMYRNGLIRWNGRDNQDGLITHNLYISK